MPCRKPFLLLCNTVAFPPSFPPSNGFFGPSTFSSSGEDGPRKNCARIGKNPSLTSDSILFLSSTSFEDIFFAEKKKGTRLNWKSYLRRRFSSEWLTRRRQRRRTTHGERKRQKHVIIKSSLLRAFSRSVVQSLFLSRNKSV